MLKRVCRYAGQFDPQASAKGNYYPSYGQYQFREGNQAFGTGFDSATAPLGVWLPPGDYQTIASSGPLNNVYFLPVHAGADETVVSHPLTVFPQAVPANWISFDLPGPSESTLGGMTPGEGMASALVEGVDVYAQTEMDKAVDASFLYGDFTVEFNLNQLPTLLTALPQTVWNGVAQFEPFVVPGRSTDIVGPNGQSYGRATALFTPAPVAARNGGALPSYGWTLADFLFQAQGAFNVIHRPRGPQGLFTLMGYDPTRPLTQAPNSTWWSATGVSSGGMTNGSFDAIELIRAQGCDPADPTAWFQEFLQVRQDWLSLLGQQMPGAFTKGLGLSASQYTVDTPVGLARTWIKANMVEEGDLGPAQTALQSGAAVASTGPLLDVTVTNGLFGTAYGPGQLMPGPANSVTLTVNLWASSWIPVDEVRVLINGVQAFRTSPSNTAFFQQDPLDPRHYTGRFYPTLPADQSAWIVVEAGVPLATTGPYQPGSTWNRVMKGLYPLAVTNPIFVDATGKGYVPPGIPAQP
jgi:hypothetical protein